MPAKLRQAFFEKEIKRSGQDKAGSIFNYNGKQTEDGAHTTPSLTVNTSNVVVVAAGWYTSKLVICSFHQ